MRLLIASLVIVASGQIALAQQNSGDVWRQESPTSRIFAAQGLLGGIELGSLLYGFSEATSEEKLRVVTFLGKKHEEISAAQLRDGLDAFYADFRNRRVETTAAAMMVIMQINGLAQAEYDGLLEKLRALR